MKFKKRALLWGLGSGFVFFLVWEQIQSVRLGYELDATRRMVELQRNRNAYLRLNLEKEQSPAWIAGVARDRLGMQPQVPERLILLDGSAESKRPRLAFASPFPSLWGKKPSQALLSRLFVSVSAVR